MSEVEALLREREGYLVQGKKDRVAQVDAELKRLGFAVGKLDKGDPEAATKSTPERAVKAKPRRG